MKFNKKLLFTALTDFYSLEDICESDEYCIFGNTIKEIEDKLDDEYVLINHRETLKNILDESHERRFQSSDGDFYAMFLRVNDVKDILRKHNEKNFEETLKQKIAEFVNSLAKDFTESDIFGEIKSEHVTKHQYEDYEGRYLYDYYMVAINTFNDDGLIFRIDNCWNIVEINISLSAGFDSFEHLEKYDFDNMIEVGTKYSKLLKLANEKLKTFKFTKPKCN